MNNPGARRPASTAPVPRPTGAVYRPPPPTSQANVALQQQQRNLPSSNLQQPQPRHNQQFHTPPAHQQLNRVRENTPPMNESQSVIEDSVPPSSQQQSQYNSQYYPSAQPEYHRPQSAHPRTVDMYRPGLPQGSMLVPATQSTNTTLMRSTSSQHLGPPKVTNSEKVIAAVSQLQTRVLGITDELRTLRDVTHDLRSGMQAIPTREEVKEELRDLLTPTLHDFFGNWTVALNDAIAPVPDLTARLAVDLVKTVGLAAPPTPISCSGSPGDKTVSTLLEHLVQSLGPVSELRAALKDLDGLPEALQNVAIFHRSIELLHHKVDKVKESQEHVAHEAIPPAAQRPPLSDHSADVLRALHRIEDRIDAMEERISSAPPVAEMMTTMKRFTEDVAFLRSTNALADQAGSQLQQLARVATSARRAMEEPSDNGLARAITAKRRLLSDEAVRRHSITQQYPLPPAFMHTPQSPTEYSRPAPSSGFRPVHSPIPETLYHLNGTASHATAPSSDTIGEAERQLSLSGTADLPVSDDISLPSTPEAKSKITKPKRVYARKTKDAGEAEEPATPDKDVFGPISQAPTIAARKRKAPTAKDPKPAKKAATKKALAIEQQSRPKPKSTKKAPAKANPPPPPRSTTTANARKAAPKLGTRAATTAPKKAAPKKPLPKQVPEAIPPDVIDISDSLDSVDTPPVTRTRSSERIRQRNQDRTPEETESSGESRVLRSHKVVSEDDADGDNLIGLI